MALTELAELSISAEAVSTPRCAITAADRVDDPGDSTLRIADEFGDFGDFEVDGSALTARPS